MITIMGVSIFALWLVWLASVWVSSVAKRGVFRRMRARPLKYLGYACILFYCTAVGSDKGGAVIPTLSMLLWNPVIRIFGGHPSVPKAETVTESDAAADSADYWLNAASVRMAATSNLWRSVQADATNVACYTLAADWNHPARDPNPKNILASLVWVSRTNLSGVVCDIHFVEFSAAPSATPAMLFDYHDSSGVTNYVRPALGSFPDTVPVSLPSGVHTCYWFRVDVPLAFVPCLRTWDNEARLGGPVGSDQGFDIAGTLLLDVGGKLWRGRTLSTLIGGVPCEFSNGMLLTPTGVSADVEKSSPSENKKGGSYYLRYPRALFRSPVVIQNSSNIVVVSASGVTNVYPLTFRLNRPK